MTADEFEVAVRGRIAKLKLIGQPERALVPRRIDLCTDLAGLSETKLRSMDPPAETMAEKRERHGAAWAAALEMDMPDEYGVTPLDEAIVEDWKRGA